MDKSKLFYKNWLDKTYGLMPHLTDHPNSFNNILFSTELIVALKELSILEQLDIDAYILHIDLNLDKEGLYKPKNSKDNILAKIVGLIAINDFDRLGEMELEEACESKVFLDRLLFNFWLDRKFYHWLLLPFAFISIIFSILVPYKVRPEWYDKTYFTFRLKALLRIIKPYKKVPIKGGYVETYKDYGTISYMQNDGKILNLFRLYLLKRERVLRPFINFCKFLYTKKLGKRYQSIVFSNYFSERNHPVRVLYTKLDDLNISILD